MVTVGWSAAHLIHYSWIIEEQLHLRSVLSKSVQCTEHCNACSRHWSAEWAQSSTTTPDHTLYNQSFKSWTNWAMKFCLIYRIHLTSCQLTTTSSSIWTTFCRENAFLKSLSNPQVWIFMLQEQTNLFLTGKSVLTVMVPILINRDVFEPSYNDLKFMV